jgi:hypothetical protein
MLGYIMFGLTDNLLLLVVGISMDKHIENGINWILRCSPWKVSVKDKVRLGIFVSMIGNSVSDFCGGLAACNIRLAVGTFVGCIVIAVVGSMITFTITRR